MTRHKDSEASSTSMYNQNDPWDPVVSFEDYIRDNENLENQVGFPLTVDDRDGHSGIDTWS